MTGKSDSDAHRGDATKRDETMRGANLSLDTKKCARRRRCSPASRHRSSGPYKGARRAAPATYRWAPLARWPTVRSHAARVRALACASFRQLKEPPKASTSRGSGEPRGALNKQTITRADLQHAPTRALANRRRRESICANVCSLFVGARGTRDETNSDARGSSAGRQQ